jgi:hypothetical protein
MEATCNWCSKTVEQIDTLDGSYKWLHRQRRIAGYEGAVGGAVVSHCELTTVLTTAMTTVGPCGRFLSLVFAVLGTGLGTERGEFGANKCDVVKQAGRRNAIDLNV